MAIGVGSTSHYNFIKVFNLKRIIVIGNGFDRAHGLETSYGHFIKYLINGAINGDKKIIEELLDVSTLIPEYRNYEYIKGNFITLDNAIEKPILGRIHFKNKFFRSLLKRYFEADWVDIENHYYSALKSMRVDNVDNFNNSQFEVIKKHLERYLFKHCKEAKIELNTDFSDIFLEDNPNSLLFLNFNYTPTVELYLDHLYEIHKIKNKEIVYIHGELNSQENSIIFGYGDDSDPDYEALIKKNDNSYLLNLKREQYNLAGSYKKLKDFINKSDNLEVYSIGHSIGLSDKTLLKEIFDHNKVSKIKMFYYKDRNGYSSLNYNLRRIVSDDTYNNKIVPFPDSNPVPQIKKED